jgi:streptogramin lyase
MNFSPEAFPALTECARPRAQQRWEAGRCGQVHTRWRIKRCCARYLGTYAHANLRTPGGLTFGADGNLYVADFGQGILRFNGNTGAYMDTFIPAGRGGLSQLSGFVFGPDGNLYVSSLSSNAVSRFEGGTGTYRPLLPEFLQRTVRRHASARVANHIFRFPSSTQISRPCLPRAMTW